MSRTLAVIATAAVVFLCSIFSSRAEDDFSYPDIFEYVPPVNLTGAVTYMVSQSRTPRGDSAVNQSTTVSVSPNTYIYEPWLATMNGTMNVTMNGQGSQSVTGRTTQSQTDTFTGNVQLNVLPQSDYPVDFSYSSSNNTMQMDEGTSDSAGTSMRLSAQQKVDEELSVRTVLQSDQSTDSSGASETSSEIQADADKRFGEDYLRIGLNHRNSIYTGLKSGSSTADINGVTVRYRSRPFDTVTSDSMSTLRFSDTYDRDVTESSAVMQGLTTAMWRPSFANDVVVHGAFRSFQDQAHTIRLTNGRTETIDRESRQANGTLTTSYPIAPRMTASLGLNGGLLTRSRTSDLPSTAKEGTPESESAISAGGNGAVQYTSLNREWQGFSWGWNAGGGGSMAMSTQGASHSENVHLGQSVTRPFDVLFIGPTSLSASQDFGFTFGTSGASIPINHSFGVTQSTRDGKTWDMWSLTFSDSRTMGAQTSAYQIVNLQVTKGYDPDRFSSWSAGVTFQAYRQTNDTEEGTFKDTMSGSITYRLRDAFGVDNLSFVSDVSVNPPSFMARDRMRDFGLGAVKQPGVMGTQRFNNRLDYMIGRLRTGVMARLENGIEGLGQVYMFQASRRF